MSLGRFCSVCRTVKSFFPLHLVIWQMVYFLHSWWKIDDVILQVKNPLEQGDFGGSGKVRDGKEQVLLWHWGDNRSSNRGERKRNLSGGLRWEKPSQKYNRERNIYSYTQPPFLCLFVLKTQTGNFFHSLIVKCLKGSWRRKAEEPQKWFSCKDSGFG